MNHRTLLAGALLLLAAACSPTPTDAPLARPGAIQRDETPPTPPTPTPTQPPADTTNRGGGGTIGSGT